MAARATEKPVSRSTVALPWLFPLARFEPLPLGSLPASVGAKAALRVPVKTLYWPRPDARSSRPGREQRTILRPLVEIRLQLLVELLRKLLRFSLVVEGLWADEEANAINVFFPELNGCSVNWPHIPARIHLLNINSAQRLVANLYR